MLFTPHYLIVRGFIPAAELGGILEGAGQRRVKSQIQQNIKDDINDCCNYLHILSDLRIVRNWERTS